MRRIQSLFKTLLMLIPMTAVPVMAIFGIPQFLPLSASPPDRSVWLDSEHRDFERRIGQSDALSVRSISTQRTPSVDLFEPYEVDSSTDATSTAGVVANAPSRELERRRLAWKDPLASSANTRTEVSLRTTSVSSRRDMGGTSIRARESRVAPAVAQRSDPSPYSGQAAVASRISETGTVGSTVPQSAAFDERATAANSQQIPPDTARFARVTREQSQHPAKLDSSRVQTLTWQQAVDRLNQLGIRTFRLMPDSEQNGYRFVCLVTSIDDPRISRRFEAESNDPLAAVGDVLAQVENWNQYR